MPRPFDQVVRDYLDQLTKANKEAIKTDQQKHLITQRLLSYDDMEVLHTILKQFLYREQRELAITKRLMRKDATSNFNVLSRRAEYKIEEIRLLSALNTKLNRLLESAEVKYPGFEKVFYLGEWTTK